MFQYIVESNPGDKGIEEYICSLSSEEMIQLTEDYISKLAEFEVNGGTVNSYYDYISSLVEPGDVIKYLRSQDLNEFVEAVKADIGAHKTGQVAQC